MYINNFVGYCFYCGKKHQNSGEHHKKKKEILGHPDNFHLWFLQPNKSINIHHQHQKKKIASTFNSHHYNWASSISHKLSIISRVLPQTLWRMRPHSEPVSTSILLPKEFAISVTLFPHLHTQTLLWRRAGTDVYRYWWHPQLMITQYCAWYHALFTPFTTMFLQWQGFSPPQDNGHDFCL